MALFKREDGDLKAFDVLHVGVGPVKVQSQRLEHVVDGDVLARLGHPSIGDVIGPSIEGTFSIENGLPIPPGKSACVIFH